MKLEAIQNKLRAVERNRRDAARKLQKSGAPASEVIDALSDNCGEMVNIAGELSQYLVTDVINAVGLTNYNAPLLAGALMAAADTVVDGATQDDEEARRRLIVAAQGVAMAPNHQRELITIKQPMDRDGEED